MTIILSILLLLALVAVAVMAGAWRKQVLEVNRVREEREAIVVEERRMFEFLHGLGEALAQDSSLSSLHRLIAEGAIDVVGARGGAFYQYREDRRQLIPTYYSKDCPPLVDLPERIVEQAKSNPLTLGSFLRLHAIKRKDGVIGEVFDSGVAEHVKDLRSHPAFKGGLNPQQAGVSAMLAPLVYKDKALGLLFVVRKTKNGSFTELDFEVFKSLAEQSAFALGNAMIHEEASEKRRLEAELDNASEIQRILLPSTSPELADYNFAAVSLPAKMVSGDYYDYVPIDQDHFGVVIGDVSGKGIPASLLTAMCRSVLRAEAIDNHSPASVLAAVNRLIFPDIREDMFISLIYLILHRESKTVTMARAGHSGVLQYHAAGGEIENHEPPGMAIGVDRGNVFERVTKDYSFEMEAGDFLLLYTDGVTEAFDSKGLEFGDTRLRASYVASAEEGKVNLIVDRLEREVQEFSGDAGQSDDITLIAIEKREE